MFVTSNDYYSKGNMLLTDDNVIKFLDLACENVHSLTFGRINQVGFDNLSPYRKEQLTKVVCDYADYLFENEDYINLGCNSYSINGVSMSSNVDVVNGVPISKSLLARLNLTGLTVRSFRW